MRLHFVCFGFFPQFNLPSGLLTVNIYVIELFFPVNRKVIILRSERNGEREVGGEECEILMKLECKGLG